MSFSLLNIFHISGLECNFTGKYCSSLQAFCFTELVVQKKTVKEGKTVVYTKRLKLSQFLLENNNNKVCIYLGTQYFLFNRHHNYQTLFVMFYTVYRNRIMSGHVFTEIIIVRKRN